ncbi:hypothetical protein CDD81_7605 [Ophiocordyceps australis]|uniref:RING-type E3 ubiquitin transferase n=1 Tax=Ophiocordyceps australis TaxID=1399860 RepID=A0A2C5X8Y7_9HYPO|nr:hypothetical protein CDD81_7605 [Ophiocordyceps australis]
MEESPCADSTSTGQVQETPAERQCVICFQAITQPCFLKPCGHHEFDHHCIGRWLQYEYSASECSRRSLARCPICRENIIDIAASPSQVGQGKQITQTMPFGHVPSRRGNHSSNYRRSTWFRSDYAESRRRQRCTRRERASLDFRRTVYSHSLYSLHMGSNPLSGYREISRQRFQTEMQLQNRARAFLRRDLRAFSWLTTPDTDEDSAWPIDSSPAPPSGAQRPRLALEKLVSHIMRLLLVFEIRGSDGHLEDDLATHLGRANAKLFIHELHSFLRSPCHRIEDWDRMVRYDTDAIATPRQRISQTVMTAAGQRAPLTSNPGPCTRNR